MPKNSTATILSRWREMDLLLWRGELRIPKFAKKHGVSQKTVRRDMEGFKALGQRVVQQIDPEGDRGDSLWWVYDGGTSLFRHSEEEARRWEAVRRRAKPTAPPGG